MVKALKAGTGAPLGNLGRLKKSVLEENYFGKDFRWACRSVDGQ